MGRLIMKEDSKIFTVSDHGYVEGDIIIIEQPRNSTFMKILAWFKIIPKYKKTTSVIGKVTNNDFIIEEEG